MKKYEDVMCVRERERDQLRFALPARSRNYRCRTPSCPNSPLSHPGALCTAADCFRWHLEAFHPTWALQTIHSFIHLFIYSFIHSFIHKRVGFYLVCHKPVM